MTYRIPALALHNIIAVHWFDAHQLPEAAGASKDLLDSECLLCDVGFYIGENKRYIAIATETDTKEPDSFRHVHYIPKVNITRIAILESK
jgi:hypothetical protein